MAITHIHELGNLADRFRGKAGSVAKAAADTINKSATFAIKASIEEISRNVTLSPSYIKKHIKTVARAKYNGELRAIIATNERGTLLSRFKNVQTSNGFRVAVNRTGGFREIKNARLMTLRSTGQKVIGLNNVAFARYLQQSGSKPSKISRAVKKALRKPRGMSPLHSRSVNQMFESVREDIQPELGRFMRKTFLEDFKRRNK